MEGADFDSASREFSQKNNDINNSIKQDQQIN